MQYAAEKGNLEAVKLLLENGCYDQDGGLTGASESNNPNFEIFEYVLSKGATDVHTALLNSCMRENIQVADFMLKRNANPNKTFWFDKTPLHYAAHQANYQLISLLLEYGANPNLRDQNGRTSLFYACERENIDCVELLMEHGKIIK